MKNRLTILALVTACLSLCHVAAGQETSSAIGRSPLDNLAKSHPRLMLTDARLAQVKQLAKDDPLLDKAAKTLLAQAQVAFKQNWGDLKAVNADAVISIRGRVYLLAFAFRWTGEQKYADKAREVLLAVAAMEDWSQNNDFLSVAEASHLLAIGYDWLYAALPNEARASLRQAIVDKGIKPYLEAYEQKQWWTRSAYNYNQVCNGGAIMAALAVADVEPDLAEQVLGRAGTSLPLALKTYDEDGLWPEGMDYWQYATQYTVWGIASLETAIGNDLGLGNPRKHKGLSRAGAAVLWAAGPFNQFVNFADTLERKKRWGLPYLFYLAARYDLPQAAAAQRDAMSRWPEVHDMAWYVPPSKTPPAPLELDKHFRGPVELATFRTAWDDPNALFVSLKAGFNEVNHGHLDLGTFELDALGVRWSRDLGRDSYGLPGYFDDRKAGGKAWEIYRLRSVSHSVPLIDGADQPLDAKASISEFVSKPQRASATVNLSKAYPAARSVSRKVTLDRAARTVTVEDAFNLDRPREIAWAMTTDAAILINGKTATLTLQGKKLIATIISPDGAAFEQEAAAAGNGQNLNKGVSRLLVRLKDVKGQARIEVLLSPQWPK